LNKNKPVIFTFISSPPLMKSQVIVREEDQAQDKGRAAVIQDVDAPPYICMQKILDFTNYPKYVSFLKKLEIYHQEEDAQGNLITSALFDAGLLTLHVGYYLRIVVRPNLNTLTWTLDYSRKSDFGLFLSSAPSSVHTSRRGQYRPLAGHASSNQQVSFSLPSPSHSFCRKMSRVLYSTEAVLPKWVPAVVARYLTKTVLVEVTPSPLCPHLPPS
jgi:hypothetical protein